MPEHKQPPNQYEAAFLKRRYQPYGDNRKLAHHLGLSVTALDARARELGIPKRRRWTRTEKQRLRERLEEDHSYQQIAAQLRRSVTAVRVQRPGIRYFRGYILPPSGIMSPFRSPQGKFYPRGIVLQRLFARKGP